jgi:hypothetical protein
MSDPTLLAPSEPDFALATPSGLTPGTRSEAEEAFMLNAAVQTDSAAPVASLTEAQRAYRRPEIPRTSSYNYENALRRAQQASAGSEASTETVGSPTSATSAFPPPGQGVVPLNYGAGAAQGEQVKKTRSRGLSLGTLAKQQGWSDEYYKHVYNAKLAEDSKSEAGYGTGEVKKAQGP